ncbi:MAG: N-6 DNA methylase, partial [Bacteroidetes bacterium]|nr:N-6 DNA methylase [Bacteroidota bacterium]
TNIDENGKTFESELPITTNSYGEEVSVKSVKLNPVKITQFNDEGETTEITNFVITEYDKTKYRNLKEYNEIEIKPLIANLDYKEFDLKVGTAAAI